MMGDPRYAYCKIFVKGPGVGSVLTRLAGVMGRQAEHDVFRSSALLVEVLGNSDTAPDPGDDFVRWPVLVEVEREDAANDRLVVDTVSDILLDLWGAGFPSVAACDFEDELPWSGGIRRLDG